jgi:hypothetical protein
MEVYFEHRACVAQTFGNTDGGSLDRMANQNIGDW